ncbi:hypothetical protein ACWEF9_15905, partial [Streptomyces sp. NPDC004980]
LNPTIRERRGRAGVPGPGWTVEFVHLQPQPLRRTAPAGAPPAGPDSQTLVVALFYSMSASGIRAQQSVDAMAVMYMTMMMVLLVAALRFVNPTLGKPLERRTFPVFS